MNKEFLQSSLARTSETERYREALEMIAMRKHAVCLEEPINWEEVANTFVGIAIAALDGATK